MNEAKNLDPAAFDRLLRLGDAAFVCKMIDLFLDYAGKKIVEARAAQAAGNLAAAARALHPIKSSAGNIGACRIQQLATQGEEVATRNEREPLAACLTELEESFAAVKPQLEERKRALSPGAPGEASDK